MIHSHVSQIWWGHLTVWLGNHANIPLQHLSHCIYQSNKNEISVTEDKAQDGQICMVGMTDWQLPSESQTSLGELGVSQLYTSENHQL